LHVENARLAKALRRAQRTVEGLTLGLSALRRHSGKLSEENAAIREELRELNADRDASRAHARAVRAAHGVISQRSRRRRLPTSVPSRPPKEASS
jgi:septal ring factor EnvC (AmiA/AmiB activator)